MRAMSEENVEIIRDGVRTFWRTWFSAWEKATFE